MKRLKLKPKKMSLIEVTQKYANNDQTCIEFFHQIKFSYGFICETVYVLNIIVSNHEMFHDVKIVLIIITYLQTQSFKITNLIFIN